MKPQTIIRSIVTGAAMAVALPALGADRGQPQGLSAVLANDDKVIAELARRDLTQLRDYMFRKNNIGADQQAAYLALSAVRQLAEPNLPARKQAELVRSIASGIEQVLATRTNPVELMELNAQLIVHGTTRGLNTMEYWGEDPKTQAQVRPIAEAVHRGYEKAMVTARAEADKLAGQINAANQPVLAPRWEKLTNLAMLAKYNAGFNLYTLALSMDKADARRVEVCEQGIKLLEDFEDEQYDVSAAVKVGIGKLHVAKGTFDGINAGKARFAEVLKSAKAGWGEKFDAVYFSAVADIVGKDLKAAGNSIAAAERWLAANPPDAASKKAYDAAMMMLSYRVHATRAAMASGDEARQANDAAISVLEALLKQRPDLQGIINEQMIARLPDQPEVGKLNTLLLRALSARGAEEIRKADDQPVEKRALSQAVAAARELIRRAGSQNVTADDANRQLLLLGYYYLRLGMDAEAANAFLDHVEKYQNNAEVRAGALDNAGAVVFKLRREQPDSRYTQDAYARFLQIATSPPFGRKEFYYSYGYVLVTRNAAAMKGQLNDAQREQMLANAQRAADLFRQVVDARQLLPSRVYELVAYEQMTDIAPKSSSLPQWAGRIMGIAEEINRIVEAQLPGAPDDQTKRDLRTARVQAALSVAGLSGHDASPAAKAGHERTLALLANLEKDVAGLPDEAEWLGKGLMVRLQAQMALGRTDAALADLGKFLEGRSGEAGLDMIIRMMNALTDEFEQAKAQNDEQRMSQLATNRARVSRYLVDRARASERAEVKALVPRYVMYEATTLEEAAQLEKDPAKRAEHLRNALAIYEQSLKATPDDPGLPIAIALVRFELGEYGTAQRSLADLLGQGRFGRPTVPITSPDGETTMQPNEKYWGAMYRLLRCNAELIKAKAPGFDEKVAEDTRTKLKQLYIQWGQPGGARWGSQFDALRQELMPEWTPAPTTEPGEQAA